MARKLNVSRLPPPVPFDPAAREVVDLAIQTARAWGHPSLTTAHLLAGIVRRSPDLVPELAGRLERIRLELEAAGISRGSVPSPIPYTGRTKTVLELARREAHVAGQPAVDPARLLAAISVDGAPIASRLLTKTTGSSELRPKEAGGSHPGDSPGLSWLELSDKSSNPYYAQLREEIERGVAAGLLLPGQRLPSVRQLAQRLDLAPGTVARAYRLLEESGVLETAGARGTTVSSRPGGARAPIAERQATLRELLRPVVVAAYHLGAGPDECRDALESCLPEVFESGSAAGPS